jgi:hypothetical protein
MALNHLREDQEPHAITFLKLEGAAKWVREGLEINTAARYPASSRRDGFARIMRSASMLFSSPRHCIATGKGINLWIRSSLDWMNASSL